MKLLKMFGIGAVAVMAPLLAATGAQAATLQCTPINGDVIAEGSFLTAPVDFSCPAAIASPGNEIIAVQIDYSLAFSDSDPNVGGHQLQASALETSADFAIGAITVTTNLSDNVGFGGTTGVGGSDTPGTANGLSLASIAAFNVGVTTISIGSNVPSDATVTVQYTTTERPTLVPEPASMLLLGTGLAGLAAAARRRKAARKA